MSEDQLWTEIVKITVFRVLFSDLYEYNLFEPAEKSTLIDEKLWLTVKK